MTRSAAVRVVAFVSVLAATIRCSESTGPSSLDNHIGVIVSGLVPPRMGTAAITGSAASPSTLRAVYVSLPPGSVPAGVAAAIRNRATGVLITTPLVDGGFDPVPIGANVGDTLAVDITTTTPGAPVRVLVIAAARRPPRIVRTNPPPGGHDVPLNATIVVVFSEPIDSATLTTASVQLTRDTAVVPGAVRLAGSYDLIAAFQPANLLAPNTTYSVRVTQQLHDVTGLGLSASLSVSFTTGTRVQTGVAAKLVFTVQPGNATAGSVLSPVVVAIQDSLGNTVTSSNDLVVMRSSCAPASACDSTFTAFSLSGGVNVTAVNGVATFSALLIGRATTGYTLVATSGTLAAATSAPFDIVPSAPAQLQFIGPGNASVAQPFTVDVAIQDALTNTVTSAANPVTVSLAAGPPGATLAGTLTVTAVRGVAHFTNLSVDQPGVYALTARANTLTDASRGLVAYTSGAFVGVSTGGNHSCGLTISGVAYCWGSNDHGQLGDGTTTNRTTAVAVAGGLTFSTMVTGGSHTCGLSSTGAWFCWGANGSGQLGDGTTSDRTTPVPAAGGLHFDALSAGGSHTCGVVTATRDLEELFYCWGLNDHGQLGDGTTIPRTTPTLVAGMGLVFGPVSAGGNHTCGLNYDVGSAYCWGANGNGQLDDGTTIDRASPVSIKPVPCGSGPPGFVPPVSCPSGAWTPFNAGITTGGAHTCAGAGGAYYNSHAGYCWGANGNGQLGDGTTTDRTTWVLVGGGRAFISLSAGGGHTCGLAGGPVPAGHEFTHDMYCWGSNSNGQIGDGTLTQRTSPVIVAGGLGFLAVSAGGNHTCGVTTAGVYCWGSNSTGQLGTGGTTDSNAPVKVAGQQ